VDVPVADDDATLGVLTVEMPPGRPLRRADLALLRDLAATAAVAFRGARLEAELSDRVDDLRGRAAELSASRERLLTANDVERDRFARAIDRDVVPHLAGVPDRLEALARGELQPLGVEPLIEQAAAALDALRGITRGIYPAQLVRSGLEPALRSLLRRDGAALVASNLAGVRFAPSVEAAAYFCIAEAEQHLSAPVRIVVALESAPDARRLRVEVTGLADGELPLAAMRDRVEAVDGEVALHVAHGKALLQVTLPAVAASAQPTAASDQALLSAAGPSADLVR
jgi:hypothetical protein